MYIVIYYFILFYIGYLDFLLSDITSCVKKNIDLFCLLW